MFLSVWHEKNVKYSELVNNPFNVLQRLALNFLYIEIHHSKCVTKVSFTLLSQSMGNTPHRELRFDWRRVQTNN